jgi:hypothetical protein
MRAAEEGGGRDGSNTFVFTFVYFRKYFRTFESMNTFFENNPIMNKYESMINTKVHPQKERWTVRSSTSMTRDTSVVRVYLRTYESNTKVLSIHSKVV